MLFKEIVELSCDYREKFYKNMFLFMFYYVISDGFFIFEFLKKKVEFLGLLYYGELIVVNSFLFCLMFEDIM